MDSCWDFALETFGHAECGDARRVRRLVQLAASAAARPGGTVTAVLRGSAEREAAYRLLESEKTCADAVAEAMFVSTVRACVGETFVFVAIDGTSLSLTDTRLKRELGGVGAWRQQGRGLQLVTALVCSARGVPVGICAQQWWARMRQPKPSKRGARGKKPADARLREPAVGESVLLGALQRFRSEAPGVTPWFQLDRGYDTWPVLSTAVAEQVSLTVRAAYNRVCRADQKSPKTYLFDQARQAPLLGSYELDVPASHGQEARRAVLDVRARPITIELKVSKKKRAHVSLHVVHVRERNAVTKKPLEWMLLTTFAVSTLKHARAVVDGYAMRWRIEEFHRVWKRGACNVENTQLYKKEALIKWATILAAVAVRSLRLTKLARETPDVPALTELSDVEIEAVILLKKPKGVSLRDRPPLGQVVRWIADLGGYVGKSSGGPPGPTVIRRGLEQVETAARAITNYREMR